MPKKNPYPTMKTITINGTKYLDLGRYDSEIEALIVERMKNTIAKNKVDKKTGIKMRDKKIDPKVARGFVWHDGDITTEPPPKKKIKPPKKSGKKEKPNSSHI